MKIRNDDKIKWPSFFSRFFFLQTYKSMKVKKKKKISFQLSFPISFNPPPPPPPPPPPQQKLIDIFAATLKALFHLLACALNWLYF